MLTIIPDRPASRIADPAASPLEALAHGFVLARDLDVQARVALGVAPVNRPLPPAWCVACGQPNDPFRADRCHACGGWKLADTREMMRRCRNGIPVASSGVGLFHGPHAASGSYCTVCGWEGPCEACAGEARWRSC